MGFAVYDFRGTVSSDGDSRRVELNDIGGKEAKEPSNNHV